MERHVTRGWVWLVVAALVLGACSDDETGGTADTGDTGDAGDGGDTRVQVSDAITTDTMWTADNVYLLTTDIFVQDGATLTIAAGTRIEGEPDSALIVTTTGRIDAQGTATSPIVFTSASATPLPSDWGGVVLLGTATLNTTTGGGGTNNIEGIDPAEGRGVYGGSDDSHDCGTLRYVWIGYAGREVTEGNELNALTLGGCGSDTVLDYLQVHKGSDDGVEFFGGTADISHFVASSGGDDGLDWQLGWMGRAQFGVVQAGNNSEHGIEADNFENGNDNLPRSNPDISNLTIIGANSAAVSGDGMRLRRGTAGQIFNTMVVGNLGGDAVDIRDDATFTQLQEGNLVLGALLFYDIGSDGESYYPDPQADGTTCSPACPQGTVCNDGGTADQECAIVQEPFFGCGGQGSFSDVTCGEDPELGDPYNRTAPNFVPAAGSPAEDGIVPNNNGFFDTSADYIGAFEPGATTTWMDGWTSFP